MLLLICTISSHTRSHVCCLPVSTSDNLQGKLYTEANVDKYRGLCSICRAVDLHGMYRNGNVTKATQVKRPLHSVDVLDNVKSTVTPVLVLG